MSVTIPLLAHITFVRFLFRVNTLVPFQITKVDEKLYTFFFFFTFKCGFSFVENTHVRFQMLEIDENASRTHRIRTVSRSCAYACGFSNYQM